jgi:hypothetical protein
MGIMYAFASKQGGFAVEQTLVQVMWQTCSNCAHRQCPGAASHFKKLVLVARLACHSLYVSCIMCGHPAVDTGRAGALLQAQDAQHTPRAAAILWW